MMKRCAAFVNRPKPAARYDQSRLERRATLLAWPLESGATKRVPSLEAAPMITMCRWWDGSASRPITWAEQPASTAAAIGADGLFDATGARDASMRSAIN
jgi:hypothetical protein